MSKNKEYWVKIDSDVMIGILAGMNIIYSRDAPVVKVVDDMKGGDLVSWVEDYSRKLSKAYLHPLSFVEALSLEMEHNGVWREICADCLKRELMDKKGDFKKLLGEYNKEDKDKTDKPKEMTSIIDLFREQSELFDKFAEVICSTKFEPVKEEVKLPDEIDLYNFFEKWGGYAKCCSLFGSVTSCHTIKAYSENYRNANGIEYFIDDNRYYALKFKDRGVFLVSEERYKELKTKKGL